MKKIKAQKGKEVQIQYDNNGIPLMGPVQWWKSYINSPEFAVRSGNDKQLITQANDKANKIKWFELPPNMQINKGNSKNYDLGSRLWNDDFTDAVKLPIPRGTSIILDPQQLTRIGGKRDSNWKNDDLFVDVLSHEVGHFRPELTPIEQDKFWYGKIPSKMIEQSKFADHPLGKKFKGNTSATDDKYLEYLQSSGVNTHDFRASENYSDLTTLRYLMYKEGIYDTRKGKMTLDDLNKALENKSIKDKFSIKRLLKLFPKEKIVELNNNIAFNPNEQLSIAQKGGAITNTGYLPNSPDRFNDYNIIPSNNITMNKVPYPIMAYPNVGQPMLMQPDQDYYFPNADYVTEVPVMKDGGIHIKSKNKGKFTKSANAAGMGVQEFARHILANKEDYSATQVKRANFARNFGGKKQDGGVITNQNRTDWNNYIDWLESKGLKGNPRLDTNNYGVRMINEYRRQVPNTTVSPEMIIPLQKDFGKYREYVINKIKSGKGAFSPGTNEDNFMKNLSVVDGIPGQRTTSFKFPSEYLTFINGTDSTTSRVGYATIKKEGGQFKKMQPGGQPLPYLPTAQFNPPGLNEYIAPEPTEGLPYLPTVQFDRTGSILSVPQGFERPYSNMDFDPFYGQNNTFPNGQKSKTKLKKNPFKTKKGIPSNLADITGAALNIVGDLTEPSIDRNLSMRLGLSDNFSTLPGGNKGDWDSNTGQFRPNSYVPIQFGNPYVSNYGIPKAQLGMPVDNSERLSLTMNPSSFIPMPQAIDNTFVDSKPNMFNPNNIKKVPENNDKSQYAFDYILNNSNLQPHQVAGIIGNLKVESADFSDKVIHGKRRGDGGKAVGIAQWHPNRWKNVSGYINSIGLDPYSLDGQLAGLIWELHGNESKALKKLNTASTAEDSAYIFDKYYERSAGTSRNERTKYAKSLYQRYMNSQTASSYQMGGEYEMSDEELQQFLKQGGQVEYI